MAWIESHQALEKHPKILRLAGLMGWSLDETIGKVHRLWWWCLDYAPTGDLRKIDPVNISHGVGLSAELSPKFIAALLQSHLVCRTGSGMNRPGSGKKPWRVHDWVDYAGRYLRDTKYRRNPEKMNAIIAFYQIPCQPTVSRQSADMSADCQPYRPTDLPTDRPDRPRIKSVPLVDKPKTGEQMPEEVRQLLEKVGHRKGMPA